jgi:lipopolysaccharide transport system permease protein
MWINEYWDLIRILAISDLRVKYQSSVLGFAWSLVNPLLMLLILYVVFSKIFNINESQFAIYILIGIVTWRFLQNGTSFGLASIVSTPGLVTKISIPRQVLVFSSVLSSFISSILEFGILFILLLVFQVTITPTVLLFPIFYVVFFVVVYGLAVGLASLFVYYRDLNQVWEVLLQAGFFLSPIVYPLSAVPQEYLWIYFLNPITVIMTINRDILLYGELPSLPEVIYLVTIGFILLMIGRFIFIKLERRFAEEV